MSQYRLDMNTASYAGVRGVKERTDFSPFYSFRDIWRYVLEPERKKKTLLCPFSLPARCPKGGISQRTLRNREQEKSLIYTYMSSNGLAVYT